MNYFFSNKSGFTLIETLFAILIFSASLVSLMTIASRGISATASARQQITAYYLAQEGLEVARNIRDTNFKTNAAWDLGLTLCDAGSPCNVVYSTASDAPGLASCSGTCPVYESLGAFVNAGDPGANPSPYGRKITIIPADPGGTGGVTEYKIIATVTWNSRSVARSVTLSTLVKAWQ